MFAKLIIALIALLMVTPQLGSQSSAALIAPIPFGFYVGEMWMPGGEYRFDIDKAIVRVRLLDRGTPAAWVLVVQGHTNSVPDSAVVIFNRYSADKIFLSTLRHPWLTSLQTALKSKGERELVTSRMLGQVRPERIVIAARIR